VSPGAMWGALGLMQALGFPSTPRARRGFWLLLSAFALAMPLLALGQALVERHFVAGSKGAALLTPALSTCFVWALWTHWHSVLFPQHRSYYLRTSAQPYRSAFLRDIFPGVSIGFAQMLRPLLNGSVLAERTRQLAVFPDGVPLAVLGGAVFVLSGWLFFAAMRTLGVARAGFVPEFLPTHAFEPERAGIYGRLRHPLFWSGVGISLGLALIVQHAAAYGVAAANLLYGFLYNELEDRRLICIFSTRYASYAERVPRCLPALRSASPLRRAQRP
jgi:protein-S-isoprenylcysteine O-methyltransferase Ste14